jgi:putative tryptophan/tyrosine transport system substrate-binding protein
LTFAHIRPTIGGMDRRRFLLTSLAGALATPLAVEAQQTGKVARIGWLGNSPATSPHLREAFRQGLRDLDYVEGRNLVIEYRFAEGKFERLRALAAELVPATVDPPGPPRYRWRT